MFVALAWIFFFTSSIFPGFHIPFLPFGRHLLLFPYTRWERLETLLLPSCLSLSSPAYQSCLNASFYLVYSSFWSLIPFSPARPVSSLNGLHLIKFCFFLSPFRMGLTNPGRALRRSCLLSISLKLLTLSGIPLFSTNSFRLASLLALLVGLNLIHFCLYSDWRRTVSSKYFDIQVPSISTEELMLPRHPCCVLSRPRRSGHSFLSGSYLSRIGRIENPLCSARGHSSQDISHLILHCPATDSMRRSLFVFLRPLVQTLGNCPASGAPWSSAMPFPLEGVG